MSPGCELVLDFKGQSVETITLGDGQPFGVAVTVLHMEHNVTTVQGTQGRTYRTPPPPGRGGERGGPAGGRGGACDPGLRGGQASHVQGQGSEEGCSMTQEPNPTTPDPVAYVKQWIQWAKERTKATQDQVATPPPNQAQLV